MKKVLFLGILFFACIPPLFSQADTSAQKQKKYNQYLGVDMGGLIMGILNSHGNTNPNINAYVLNYSINSKNTGWGIRLGVGYTYSSNTTVNEGTTAVMNNNDFRMRIGVEKLFRFSKRWTAGAGIDLLIDNNNDNTNSVARNFDTVTTLTKILMPGYGGGIMAWLRYSITKNILIGTEASVYFTTGKMAYSTAATTVEQGKVVPSASSSSSSDYSISEMNMTGPATLFLIVQF